jgi:cation transport ATPase
MAFTMGGVDATFNPTTPHPTPAYNRWAVLRAIKAVDLARWVIVALGAITSWRGSTPRFDGIEPLSLAAVIVGSSNVFCEAVDNLPSCGLTPAFSMILALTVMMIIKDFSAALLILFLVLSARMIEAVAISHGRQAAEGLVQSDPPGANQYCHNRLSKWLVYFALAAAVIEFALTRNIHRSIAILIAAGACDLS